MAYTHVQIKKFAGLALQPNTFTLPDGALEVAENVVISDDFTIRKRPGFFTFHTPSGPTLNNVYLYEDNLVAACNDRVRRISTSGVGTDLTGETFAATSGHVARSAQSNDNLYLTSDNGVMKLTAYDSQVTKAGVPPALDLQGAFIQVNLLTTTTLGPIAGDTQVAYRVLFGKKDDNKNLLLGAPSDILVLNNSPVADLAYTVSGAGPYTITVTSTDHGLISGMLVDVTEATSSQINGSRQITVTGVSSFTFSFSGTAPSNGTLTYSYYRKPRIEFSVPTEITDAVDDTSFFYQIYRSSQSTSASAVPSADFKLAKEEKLTAAQLLDRIVFYDDDVDDVFLQGAAELYTNPNSGEGELQENSRPPYCEDIVLFKDQVFYFKIRAPHLFNLQLISSNTTATIWGAGDYVEIKRDATTRKYVARGGVGNSTVTGSTTFAGAVVTVTYTAHGLVNGDTIYVSNPVGTGTLPSGEYTINTVAANTFNFTAGATPTTLTYIDFEGVRNTSSEPIFQLVDSATALSSGLYATASGFVRAVNRDNSGLVYARYISGIDDLPGKMFFEAKNFSTSVIQFRAVSAGATTPGEGFSPVLTSAFTDNESEQDDLPNVVAVSKIGEPEAVPRINRLVVGSRKAPILRGFALRDSILVLKQDGVFRIDGDRISNYATTILDNTLSCLAPSSAALINNQVMFLADQGVSLASATSVEIISREGIELPLQSILGNSALAAQTSAVSHESARLYLLTTLAPNESTASEVYAYNTITRAWTTWNTYFKQGVVGPSDTLYLITTANILKKQRKNLNRLDFTDESYSVTVTTVSSTTSVVLTSASIAPAIGDVITYLDVINRILSVTSLGGTTYSVTFEKQINLVTGANTLYKGFQSQIKFAPFHGGLTNRDKHFAQFQIQTRGSDISRCDVTFANEAFGSSEVTEWSAYAVASASGWGNEPWGLFPWGQQEGIDLLFGTQPSIIIRLYIPRFAARGSYIQPIITHISGAEPMNIQAVGYQLRAYQERVTR